MTSDLADGSRSGLLLDYGGVLTTHIFNSFAIYSERMGMEREAVHRHFREPGPGEDLLVAMEEGRISIPEFEERFGELLGVPGPHEGLARRLQAEVTLEPLMVAAARAAHDAGIRTGLLSNSWGMDYYDADLLAAFDTLVISEQLGVRKPAERIYEIAVEQMAMPASELIFVDDLGVNLKPAKALGMATIKHTSPETTVSELERLLGVMLRASDPSS